MIRVLLIMYLALILSDFYLKTYRTHTAKIPFSTIWGQLFRNLTPIVFLFLVLDLFTWNIGFIAIILSILYILIDLLMGQIEKRRAEPNKLTGRFFRNSSFVFVFEQALKMSMILLICYLFDPYSISQLWAKAFDFIIGPQLIYDPEVKLIFIAIVLAVMMRVSAHLISLIVDDLGTGFIGNSMKNSIESALDDSLLEAAATAENHPLIDRFIHAPSRGQIQNIEIAESLEIREKDQQNNQLDIVRKVSKVHQNFVSDPKSVGRYIGMIERVLIVFFVVNSAYTAIAFIGAVKTLARFKQFDDKRFAEYYLLGTLLSALFGFAGGFLLTRVI